MRAKFQTELVEPFFKTFFNNMYMRYYFYQAYQDTLVSLYFGVKSKKQPSGPEITAAVLEALRERPLFNFIDEWTERGMNLLLTSLTYASRLVPDHWLECTEVFRVPTYSFKQRVTHTVSCRYWDKPKRLYKFKRSIRPNVSGRRTGCSLEFTPKYTGDTNVPDNKLSRLTVKWLTELGLLPEGVLATKQRRKIKPPVAVKTVSKPVYEQQTLDLGIADAVTADEGTDDAVIAAAGTDDPGTADEGTIDSAIAAAGAACEALVSLLSDFKQISKALKDILLIQEYTAQHKNPKVVQLQQAESDGGSASPVVKAGHRQSFANGASIQLTHAKTPSDRVRGISADRIGF